MGIKVFGISPPMRTPRPAAKIAALSSATRPPELTCLSLPSQMSASRARRPLYEGRRNFLGKQLDGARCGFGGHAREVMSQDKMAVRVASQNVDEGFEVADDVIGRPVCGHAAELRLVGGLHLERLAGHVGS